MKGRSRPKNCIFFMITKREWGGGVVVGTLSKKNSKDLETLRKVKQWIIKGNLKSIEKNVLQTLKEREKNLNHFFKSFQTTLKSLNESF